MKYSWAIRSSSGLNTGSKEIKSQAFLPLCKSHPPNQQDNPDIATYDFHDIEFTYAKEEMELGIRNETMKLPLWGRGWNVLSKWFHLCSGNKPLGIVNIQEQKMLES